MLVQPDNQARGRWNSRHCLKRDVCPPAVVVTGHVIAACAPEIASSRAIIAVPSSQELRYFAPMGAEKGDLSGQFLALPKRREPNTNPLAVEPNRNPRGFNLNQNLAHAHKSSSIPVSSVPVGGAETATPQRDWFLL